MPFVPTDIAGCTFWARADSLSLSDDDPVGTWPDESGNGKDLTQSGSPRPTFKAATLNGLPVVRLDGSDDYMSTPSGLATRTMFAVVRYASSGNYPTFLSPFGRQAAIAHIWTFQSGSTSLYTGSSGLNHLYRFGILTNDNAPIDDWAILAVVPPAQVTDAWDLGRNDTNNGRLWAGDFAELIAYSGGLSDPDRETVEAYLAAKWFTPASATTPSAQMLMM